MKIDNKIRYVKSNNNVSIIKLMFPSKIEKNENKSILNILSYILSTSCNEISDYKLFNNHLKELGILSVSFDYKYFFDTVIISFDLEIPNKDVYEEFDLEKAFEFFAKIITKPYVEDNHFNDEKFNYEKDYIYEKFKSRITYFYYKCSNYFFSLLDPKDKLEINYENYLNKIASVSSTDAYEFYKKHVLNNNFLTFVYGKYDFNDIEPLFNKYLKINRDKIDIKIKKIKPFKFTHNLNVESVNESNQSICYIAYKINNFNKNDLHYYDLFYDFINSKNEGSLMDILRINNSLIYDVDFISYIKRGFFVLELSISDVNKKKALKLVSDFFESIKVKKYLKTIVNDLVEEYEIELLESMDNEFYNFNEKINKLLKFDSLKDDIKFYKEINIDEFYNFINRIEQVALVYLRGEQDE